MLGIIQTRSSVVTQQPPGAANVQVGSAHPVAPANAPASPAGAVVPAIAAGAAIPAVPAIAAAAAGRLARLPAQLAGLPARFGRIGARSIIGGGATGIGMLTAGSGIGGLIGAQIQAYSQGHFAENRARYAHDSAITGGMLAAGVAVTVAGVLLMRSARAAALPAADNQGPTAPSTPSHAPADGAV